MEAVLDSTQAVVAGYRYDPFGVLLAQTGSFEQPYGFSTKRYDEQTGLVAYQYRFYSPTLGRWITRDPLGETGGMNLYAFVGNNPINWVDPWGLKPGDTFDTMEEAVIDALNYIYPKTNTADIKDRREYGGTIIKRHRFAWNKEKLWFDKITEYTYNEPREGGLTWVAIPIIRGSVCTYHSHPDLPGYDSENFSTGKDEDIDIANKEGLPSFLITPSRVIKRYDPHYQIMLPGGYIGTAPLVKDVPGVWPSGIQNIFKF